MKDVKVSEYRLTTHTDQTYYYAKVSKITVSGREFDLRLPKENYNGSHFGICSCGFPSKEGLPSCQHMVVLVKANVFPILTRVIFGQLHSGRYSTRLIWTVTEKYRLMR